MTREERAAKIAALFPVRVIINKQILKDVNRIDPKDCVGARLLKRLLKKHDIQLEEQDDLNWGYTQGGIALRDPDCHLSLYNVTHVCIRESNGLSLPLVYKAQWVELELTEVRTTRNVY